MYASAFISNQTVAEPYTHFNLSASQPCGNEFSVTQDGKIYLVASASCNGVQTGPRTGAGLDAVIQVLDTSLPRAQWAWQQGCFPVTSGARYFTLYDSGYPAGNLFDRQAFALVDHPVDDPLIDDMPVGILYAADKSGSQFSLSLPWVYRPADRYSHLTTSAEYLPYPSGVGLAATPAVMFGVVVDVLSLATDTAYLRRQKEARDALMVRISRDSGATWAPLRATGLPGCSPTGPLSDDCTLHLHAPMMATRDGSGLHFTGVYSNAAAPGVVMATGNTGKYLSLFPNQTSTFASLDGGRSWTRVASSSQTYEIAANGAVLLRADDMAGSVSCVYYVAGRFTNLGDSASWACAPLSPPAARITSMAARVTSRSGSTTSSRTVIVYGVDAANNTLIYTLDFRTPAAGLPLLPPCSAAQMQTVDAAACRFGRSLQLVKRLDDAACYPGPVPGPSLLSSKSCGCSPADVTCAWGWFAAKTTSGADLVCHAMPSDAFFQAPGCPAQSPSGVVQNPASECVAPPPHPPAGPPVGIIVGVVLGALALLGVAFAVRRATQQGLFTFFKVGALFVGKQPARPALNIDDEGYIMAGSAGGYTPPGMM
jgi:hypothetical protein